MSLGGGNVYSADFQEGLLVNGHMPTQKRTQAAGDYQLRYHMAEGDGGQRPLRPLTSLCGALWTRLSSHQQEHGRHKDLGIGGDTHEDDAR
jgi:hypothetical protein